MNPTHKRLRLSPPTRSSASHDALLPPPPPARGEEEEKEEEEEEGYLLVEEDTTDSSLIITMEDSQLEVKTARRRAVRKRKRRPPEEEEAEEERGRASESEEEAGVEVEIDRQLDQSLETKSKQHNLTTVNVRNIIHEVITNEHVVAMMKAAINETEAVPPFEPKMTRSKFKEAVERGGGAGAGGAVVIPSWNISPIKKTCDTNKAPQFMDIPLAEEDSSDEEYCPDEEEEDETAEDTFQESDMESTASSPRGSRLNRMEEESCSPWQTSRSRSRRLRPAPVSMGPPPPPKAPPPKVVTDSTFLEKLHAVEEELAVCMEPYQPLSESEDEAGLMAYRTRSKRPLRDVPLGRLEAALQAPDITPDMYDSSSAHEDREWTDWLRGLMSSDVDQEEECDDEDDPEYNFLADIDEPDKEDYRDDKAVRITKKEVNELMEELFETLKEDLTGQEVDDEGHEEEEEPQEETHTVQTHTAEQQEHTGEPDHEPEHRPVAELHTVKQQLEFIRRRQPHTPSYTTTHSTEPHTLRLSAHQRRRLKLQLQQHVQLLTQVHLLTSPVIKLQSEAETTRQFLVELEALAQRAELISLGAHPGFCSSFRASNLQGALQLLEELRQTPISYEPQQRRPDARGHMRCFPVMPAELAWIFATRPIFLHPELLPCTSLDPALYCPRRTAAFTAAEDCLLVLGLRNMEGSCDPPKLVSQFLLRKTLVQIRRRILQCCRPGFNDNIVKAFRYQRLLWSMPVACRCVDPAEHRPPVEREESILPLWLARSLPVIYPTIRHYNSSPPGTTPEPLPPCRRGGARQSHLTFLRSTSSSCSLPAGTRYPPRLPEHLDFRRIGFVLLHRPLPPPPPTDSVPSSSLVLQRLVPTRANSPADTTSTVSTATREQITRHAQTLARLRRSDEQAPPSPLTEGPAPFQVVEDDVMRTEEKEEEGDVRLALSESSDDDLQGAEPQRQQEETVTLLTAEEDGVQEELSEEDEEDDDQRELEDMMFAKDYLHRVCEVLQVSPGVSEQLLQELNEFSGPLGTSGAPEDLYRRLSGVLQPWPQLLRDFAAFLTRTQAQRCGLLVEQQLFERSRQFLQRLRQRLGESSALYQQVVSALQGSSASSPEDIQQVLSLLKLHPHLQQEVQLLLQQLRPPLSPIATRSKVDSISHNAPDLCPHTGSNKEEEQQQEKAEDGQPVCAKNISLTFSGEKVIVWTREADRTILTFCQQRGANRRTFQQISAHLGNKTAHQVRQRFQDLMRLFHLASHKSTCPSSENRPISRQDATPD